MSDTSSIFIWWFAIFITGLVFLPITFSLFHKFIDRGYIFSKVLGIVATSYMVWLLGSLKLLPFTRLTIIIVILACLLISLWLLSSRGKHAIYSKLPLSLMIFEEAVFFLALSFWSYVRATEPSIRGLEKFMDFGFVNSILRANYFPPLDMWLTKSPDYAGGFFINYYYFGHYITAFLTKLTGIDSAITYNLMLATLFAFTFTLPFSIGMNLYYLFLKRSDLRGGPTSIGKPVIVGLLAAFLVALGGNLHTLYVYTTGYPNEAPQPPWKLEAGFHPERYWYPNATRFIPFTIHEFPIYSFVVADLHGHVSDIPLVLTTLALLLALIVSENKKRSDESAPQSFLPEFENHTNVPFVYIVILGVMLAAMYMTNAWDGFIYMMLAGLVILFRNIVSTDQLPLITRIYKTFSACLFLLFAFLLASLPFSFNFKPFVSGIGVLCAPKFLLEKSIGPFLFETGKCQKSPFYMLTILWGFFYFNVLGFLIFIIFPKIRTAFSLKLGKINYRFSLGLLRQLPATDIFISILILLSTFLLVFPEFFYIKDIYPAHFRANTMFKLGYQAFMMLGIVSAYIFLRIKQLTIRKNIFLVLYNASFILLFSLVAIYPYFAINSYYGNLKTYHGLYGLNWLMTQYPDDYQAIEWLRKNIPENIQPVIVEANGDSYTDYDRVSANTGLPTIIGWPVHEWLWRGSYDEAGKRIPEVVAIYESQDTDLTKQILRKYNVEYVFVGALEKEKYKNLNESKFDTLGKVVFQSGTTKIYKITL